MKKIWSKPELVILQRDKAEAVLALCKQTSGSSGPTSVNSGCYQIAAPCTKCNAQVGS
jgi:hypothetical protein